MALGFGYSLVDVIMREWFLLFGLLDLAELNKGKLK